jgi:hypothetical protein
MVYCWTREHGHAWMAGRIRAEAARLPALVAGASLRCSRARDWNAWPATAQANRLGGWPWNHIGHTPTPARVSQPTAYSRSSESGTCAAGRRVSSRRKPRTPHLHRLLAIAAATTKASRQPCITLKRRICGCRGTDVLNLPL